MKCSDRPIQIFILELFNIYKFINHDKRNELNLKKMFVIQTNSDILKNIICYKFIIF